MKIILSGYMGCGKSIVGKELAKKLGNPFLDLDAYICSKEGKTIASIFKTGGEVLFRKKERAYLEKALLQHDDLVLSLGGGTPCFGDNLAFIKDQHNTMTVYLHATAQELVARLFDEKDHRPLIAHIETTEAMLDFINKHLFERSFYYNQSEVILKTDGKSPKAIINELMLKIA